MYKSFIEYLTLCSEIVYADFILQEDVGYDKVYEYLCDHVETLSWRVGETFTFRKLCY